MSEQRFELIKRYKERQDKFIYYVLGLNVASIGYSLSNSFKAPIEDNHVLLFIALLSWLLSSLFAVSWIYAQLELMGQNIDGHDIIQGTMNLSEEEKSAKLIQLQKQMSDNNDKCVKALKRMLMLFFAGVVFFVLWRVFDFF